MYSNSDAPLRFRTSLMHIYDVILQGFKLTQDQNPNAWSDFVFACQNSLQAIPTHNLLQVDVANLQFDPIVQWRGSLSTLLIAHWSGEPQALEQRAKKNRMFCCSQSESAVNKAALFSQRCPQLC